VTDTGGGGRGDGAMGRSPPPWAVFFNFYIINYNIGLELTESYCYIVTFLAVTFN